MDNPLRTNSASAQQGMTRRILSEAMAERPLHGAMTRRFLSEAMTKRLLQSAITE
jgi:hypothetical protein